MSALSWQSLAVRYGAREAVSLGAGDWAQGSLIALLGPNGSGKTSLLKALAGALDGGSVDVDGLRIAGEDADGLGPAERARRIAYLSQTRTGPALAAVRDVVALGRFPHRDRDAGGRVEAVMARLDLGGMAERRFGTLSGGEQARVLLARALAVQAPILLADEPTAALDPYYALSIMDALRREADAGALVVVSLHDLSLAGRYADRVVVLQDGRAVADGSPGEALEAGLLERAFRVRRGPGGELSALDGAASQPRP